MLIHTRVDVLPAKSALKKMKKITSVTDYIDQQEDRHEDLLQLRKIFLSSGLEEHIKWGAPCYSYQNKNLIGLVTFKHHIAIWFHQGALLADKHGLLVNVQEEKTKALRKWRIESFDDLKPKILKAYIEEAKSYVEQGIFVKIERNKPLVIPDLLAEALSRENVISEAFQSLSLSKQREYTQYIDDAKRDATKQKRLLKILPMIEQGVGLNDKYR